MFVRRENGKIVEAYVNAQGQDGEEYLPEDSSELVSFLNPPPPPYTISADVPWTRIDDDEAELVQAGIDAAPVKTKNMISKATSFTEGTDAFNKFVGIIALALNSGRAAAIMGQLSAAEMDRFTETASL